MQKSIGIVIGRMNPPHKGHLFLIKEALKNNDKVIVVLGSAYQPATPKNPFSVSERKQMLTQMCTDNGIDCTKLVLTHVQDYLYSDLNWVNAVKSVVHKANGEQWSKGTVYGHVKDSSSEYLRWFAGHWDYCPIPTPFLDQNGTVVSSTRIRELMFSRGLFALEVNLMLDAYSETMLEIFRNWIDGPNFHNLVQDFEYYRNYKLRWEVAPFAPVFVTGDAVVFCNGHVLVVTRKGPPGRDTFALPGGFIDQEETIKDCILRELKEETKIDVPPGKLKNCMRQIVVFDAPQRSLRGRTITHAGVIVLEEPALPRVRGSDDAKTAQWISLHKLNSMQDQFFEDHWHIIDTLKTI